VTAQTTAAMSPGKRILLLLLILVLAAAAVHLHRDLCDERFSSADNVVSTTTLNISMALGESEWEIMRSEVFPAFEREHSCTIKAVNIEAVDLLQKVELMHKAGSMEIDVMFLDNMNLAPYVEKRLVLDLSPYRDLMDSAVYSSLVEPLEFAGSLMFFPGRPNVQITYYNTDIFDGKRYRIPRTWDELIEVSRRLKEEFGAGKVAIHGTLDPNTTTHVFEFVQAAGGDITVLNDEGCVKAFTFLQKLYPHLSPESRKANWNTTNKFISEESVYLARNWPFGMNVIVQQNRKTNIQSYDTWSGPAGKATMIGGDVIAIPRRGGNHELALNFAVYLMSAPVQTTFVTRLGWPPIRNDTLRYDAIRSDAPGDPSAGSVPEWQKPFFDSVMQSLDHGHYRPPILGWSAVDNYVNKAFKDIVVDGKDVKATLDRYAGRLKEELDTAAAVRP